MPLDKNRFVIKRNDTLPALQVCILDVGCSGGRKAFSLSGATGVTFSMVNHCGDYKISKKAGQILSSTGGTIQYTWTSSDTNESGKFKGEFQINYSDGGRLSIPQQGFIDIEIYKDIIPD